MINFAPEPRPRPATRRRRSFGNRVIVAVVTIVTVMATAAATISVVQVLTSNGAAARGHVVISLPANPDSYLGAYTPGNPVSYRPMERFISYTGVQPNIALYYSGWGEPFRTTFAIEAALHHAVPMVQIDPGGASIPAIVAGDYDGFLGAYAAAVAKFGASTGSGVIVGFGHEPNGPWYPWGYKHVSPVTWIAAWRHIVTIFRKVGADNVTWLWTVNIIDSKHGIPSPAAWWPGAKYVTWVGIDGYYYDKIQSFPALFGPVIKAIHALTTDPILVSETGAAPAAGKAAKIADLFSGIRSYGLLGLVWFNVSAARDWTIDTANAVSALRAGASAYGRLAP